MDAFKPFARWQEGKKKVHERAVGMITHIAGGLMDQLALIVGGEIQ